MRINLDNRLTAAVLYLFAAFCQFGILVVLFDIGGSEGLSYLLSAENPARSTVTYLIVAGIVSLGLMAILLLSRSASKSAKGGLLVLAIAQLLGGIAYAQITVVSTAIAFGFLVAYCRVRTA